MGTKTKQPMTPPTPPVPEVMTLAKVVDHLMYELDSRIKSFETKKVEWLKDVEKNPADAVQWSYEKISLYQYEYENAMLLKNNTMAPVVAMMPEFEAGNMTKYTETVQLMKQNMEHAIEHFTDKVICTAKWPSHSTSQISNMNTQTRLAADATTLELLKATLKRVLKIEGC